MPQPIRNWYFEPDPGPQEAGTAADDDGVAPGLTCLPAASLRQHGARVLNPSDAPAIPGGSVSGGSVSGGTVSGGSVSGDGQAGWARTPSATVYRARTLLIPADLLRDDAVVRAIDTALARVGMSIVLPDLDGRRVQSGGAVAEALQRLPRIVGLVPAAPAPGRPALPVVVDAWMALQTLRAAADAAALVNPPVTDDPTAREGREAEVEDAAGEGAGVQGAAGGGTALTAEIVRRIGLEHLLAGSALRPLVATEGNAISGSPATEGNGLTGSAGTSSYVYVGGDTRAPVTVCLRAPARRTSAALGGRRPVVAVLDTGVRAHPWLDVWRDPAGGYAVDQTDGFVMDAPGIQDVIYAEASYAAAEQGDHSRVLIRDAWDGPVAADPLLGELGDATGHGTFIAGIVRQAAPDARVLAIRIMHSDDVVYEGDLLCALALLADRIAAAEGGSMADMVDVVSLSLGYFDESAADVTYSSGLWQVIELLLDLGVAVLAAAGNYSTTRRFYPAAFSLQPSPVPVIAVGALNTNGTRALFSDGGRWVRAWAAGAAVVSTYPDDVDGSLTPPVRVPAHDDGTHSPDGGPETREALDPDDYRGGFATWSGTSFAAPLIAAHIAARLLDQALGQSAQSLDLPGNEAATDRTRAALDALGWPGGA